VLVDSSSACLSRGTFDSLAFVLAPILFASPPTFTPDDPNEKVGFADEEEKLNPPVVLALQLLDGDPNEQKPNVSGIEDTLNGVVLLFVLPSNPTTYLLGRKAFL